MTSWKHTFPKGCGSEWNWPESEPDKKKPGSGPTMEKTDPFTFYKYESQYNWDIDTLL